MHGLVTLEGPTTIAFPNSPELQGHRLIAVNSKTGEMTVQKIVPSGSEELPPYQVKTGGQSLVGETLIFGGADYKYANNDREAIQHASPPTSDLNRLTLFISFRPRK